MNHALRSLTLSVLLCFPGFPVFAQDHHAESPDASEHGMQDGVEEGHGETHGDGHGSGHSEEGDHGHHHKNILSAFVGVTGEDRRAEAFTIGLDYNRWVTPSFGVGAGVERAFNDPDFTVWTVPLSYRWGSWKLFAGPGWEVLEDDDNAHSPVSRSGDGSGEGGTEFLVRVGVEYAIPVGRYEIAPKLMADFIDGDAVFVLGVGFGLGF